jgi:hypothetical protein
MATDTPIFDAVKADLGGDPRTPPARALDFINTVLAGIGAIIGLGDLFNGPTPPTEPAALYGPLGWSTLDIEAPIYERLVRERGRPVVVHAGWWDACRDLALVHVVHLWAPGDPS